MLHVTEHALLKYLERFKGVDVETIRRETGEKDWNTLLYCVQKESGYDLDEVRKEILAPLTTYREGDNLRDGINYVVKGKDVVTVFDCAGYKRSIMYVDTRRARHRKYHR